jgi:hypothetical protein
MNKGDLHMAIPTSSPTLAAIQERSDAPFGMLFLGVYVSQFSAPELGNRKVTTQTNEETSNDGKSKLDPIYDEDENADEEIPEKY